MPPLSPVSPAAPPSRPRKRWKRILFLYVPLLVLALGAVGVMIFLSGSESALNRVMAELDRNDPGWRLEDLEAQRVMPADPDNAALSVQTAHAKLPKGWPMTLATQPPPPAPDLGGGEGMVGAAGGPGGSGGAGGITVPLSDRLAQRAPEMQLEPSLIPELKAEMDALKPVLDVALGIKDQKVGRFPITWPANPMMVILPVEKPRQVTQVLQWQILLDAQEGRMDNALRAARAMLGVSRSIGDEPTLISMLVRCAIRAITMNGIERVLAQGEPSAEALETLQADLVAEEQINLLLMGYRGERALNHELMLFLKKNQTGATGILGGPNTNLGAFVERMSMPILVRSSHPSLLALLTRAVEVAKLPPEQQKSALDALENEVRTMSPREVLVRQLMPAVTKVGIATVRDRAMMRCQIAGVAAERFRRDNQRWPKGLSELTPKYLPEGLKDPYDGQPLRWKNTPEGVIIYSLGEDRTDNAGVFNRQSWNVKGSDIGIQLWNVAGRRQPFAEPLPFPDQEDIE